MIARDAASKVIRRDFLFFSQARKERAQDFVERGQTKSLHDSEQKKSLPLQSPVSSQAITWKISPPFKVIEEVKGIDVNLACSKC